MIESATRDGEIPAIFNPKRVRTPSVVVTGDSPNGPFSGFVSIPPITHSDSVTSSQPGDGAESLTGIIIGDLSVIFYNRSKLHSLIFKIYYSLFSTTSSQIQHLQKGLKQKDAKDLVVQNWHKK